jgi:4-hydroxymandelate oxidase
MACPLGEIATAQAAEANETLMVLSSLSTTSPEEVAASTKGPLWFQLYIYKDRNLTKNVVERVEELGYKALCITVDAPLLGRRERDVRNRFSLPDGLRIATVGDYLEKSMAENSKNSSLNVYFASLLDQSVTWKDIEWIRSISKLPIIVKGIHRPDDAIKAIEHGIDGIVVSNHGARQLDTVPATIDLLPSISNAVNGKLEIFLDGGIRRGTDVIKAIALGARAVLIGRPILWGLAVDGGNGASAVLRLIKDETDLAMALCGISKISEANKDLIGYKNA